MLNLSRQNGRMIATTKNGSQQTTKEPVTMARVRAAFLSRLRSA